MFFLLQNFLLELYPSTCTSILDAKLFLSWYYTNYCYKREKIPLWQPYYLSTLIICIILHTLPARAWFNVHPLPQDLSVQCQVLSHTCSCKWSLSWRKWQADKRRTRQERKNIQPNSGTVPVCTTPHFCFHSTISSCAKSNFGSLNSLKHFGQHLGIIIWLLKDCLSRSFFYTCMPSQAFKRSTFQLRQRLLSLKEDSNTMAFAW